MSVPVVRISCRLDSSCRSVTLSQLYSLISDPCARLHSAVYMFQVICTPPYPYVCVTSVSPSTGVGSIETEAVEITTKKADC